MKTTSRQTSELNPRENMTPSTKTTLTGLLVIAPLFLILLGFFTGFLNI
ncbi:purine permease, putative [Stanieria cyanosphaera PCC 7437]|uniref:Purine permease, putative n=1 Tax=Stanieria cyanosphaera (strain ATCC 29371 / PCC 7437) TaxID=111780 RepID=K9XSS1_STAC7|nr:hypothetical protein [Stanieria cyanosphaera]AFZ35650.1 purine permease, putative [Stanieria cyanosphaera PCC 7437]